MSEFGPGGAREIVRGDFGWNTALRRYGLGGEGGQEFEDVLPVTDHGTLTGLSDDDHDLYLKKASEGGLGADVPTHAHGFSTGAFAVDLTLLTNNTNASGTVAVNSSGVYIATAQDRFRCPK